MLNIFYNNFNHVPVCNRNDRLSSLQSVSLIIMCGLHVILLSCVHMCANLCDVVVERKHYHHCT